MCKVAVSYIDILCSLTKFHQGKPDIFSIHIVAVVCTDTHSDKQHACMNVCTFVLCMYVCVRACVIWVREGGTPHMHGHKAFHLQLVSEPTHSYQGGISGNVLPFPPLCRPAWYSSNSDVLERRIFHHVRVKYHS